MGKLDELRRSAGQNVKDSTGGSRGPLPGAAPAAAQQARWQGVTRQPNAVSIPVTMIVRDPGQPREEFDQEALERLAESLRIRGQLQPIRVRWDEAQVSYVVLVGERRWRAARMAGLTHLSCVLVEGDLPDEERLMIQLVENALREDLKPVEQARSYRRLMDVRDWSTRELAAELHVAQSSVVRSLALLDLPCDVQTQVEQGALAATVAAELAKLPSAADQSEVARAVVEKGLTRSEVSEVIQAVRAKRPAPPARPDPVTLDVDGVLVTLRWKRGGGALTAIQVLRKAMKMIQERDRTGQAATEAA